MLDRIAKPDCHNTSSAVQKKILLIMGIEKRLGVTLPEGEERPGTTEELARRLYRCLGERRGSPGGPRRERFFILEKGDLRQELQSLRPGGPASAGDPWLCACVLCPLQYGTFVVRCQKIRNVRVQFMQIVETS